MKVYIGPYINWFGPYQFARLFKYLGCSEDTCDHIGDWMPLWPFSIIQGLRRPRKEHVRIDKYDTWDADHTLALIIHPMLVQLKATKHGSPFIEDADVPEKLRSTNAKPKEHDWDTDEFHHDRWDWVLDEMIYTFQTRVDDTWEDRPDSEEYVAELRRIKNGFILFGKYYQNLWD